MEGLKSVGVLTTDNELIVRSWDRWLVDATGIAAEAACGQSLLQLVPDLEPRGLLNRVRRVLDTGAVEVLAPAFHHYFIPCPPRQPTAHFTRMQQHVTISPLRRDGSVTGVVVTVEDVTARLQRERELAAQLSSQDEAIRLRATRALANESAGPDVLVEAFADTSWRVRRMAVEGFRRRTGEDMAEALAQALREQHRDFSVLNATLSALAVAGGDVLPGVLDALASDDADLRIYAALALGHLRDERAVGPLLDALDDGDANVRFHAIEALGRLHAHAAADRLADIAASGDFFLAFPALDALGQLGESRVASRLLPLLDEPALAAATVDTLGQIGAEDVVTAVAAQLGTDVPVATVAGALATIYRRFETTYGAGELIADLARSALGADAAARLVASLPRADDDALSDLTLVLGWLEFDGVDRALAGLLGHAGARPTALDALVLRGRRAVAVLIEELREGDREARKAAASALGRIGNPDAVAALLALLQDDSELAIVAASALGSIGDSRAFEPLLELLDHDEAAVRHAAVAALNSIGHPDMQTRLQTLLTHSAPHVRDSAARIAGYFGYVECVDAMLRLATDPDDGVRRAALEHLGFFPDGRVIETVAAALRDASPRTRAAAARALGHMSGRAVLDPLLVGLRDADAWVRYYAARSAGSHGDHAVIERLSQLAQADPAPPVRIAAIEALGRIGDAAVLPTLTAAADASETEVAEAALAGIARIGGPDALPPLVSALRSAEPERRLAALRALTHSSLAYEAVNDILWSALAEAEPHVAGSAIELLSQIGTPEAVAALVQLAADPARRAASIAALAAVPEERIGEVSRGLSHPDSAVRCAVVEALARRKHARASRLLAAALEDDAVDVRSAAAHALSRMDLSQLEPRSSAGDGERPSARRSGRDPVLR